MSKRWLIIIVVVVIVGGLAIWSKVPPSVQLFVLGAACIAILLIGPLLFFKFIPVGTIYFDSRMRVHYVERGFAVLKWDLQKHYKIWKPERPKSMPCPIWDSYAVIKKVRHEDWVFNISVRLKPEYRQASEEALQKLWDAFYTDWDALLEFPKELIVSFEKFLEERMGEDVLEAISPEELKVELDSYWQEAHPDSLLELEQISHGRAASRK